MSEKTVARLNLKPLREEKLGVKTFGSSEPEIVIKKVYAIPLVSLSGGRSILIEALMIDELPLLLTTIWILLIMHIYI